MASCLIKEIIKKNECCYKANERLRRKGVGVKASDGKINKNDHKGEKLNDVFCPWHIDDDKYLNCFWVYLMDPKNNREHQLIQIAKLLKTSVNNIKLIETSVFTKLKKKLTHLKKNNL